MTAQPALAESRHVRLEFWSCFADEVRRRIRDANYESGEILWTMSTGGDPQPWIKVASTSGAGCLMRCSFDAERGILRNGAELPWARSGCRILAEEMEYDAPALATRLLDELARADDEF